MQIKNNAETYGIVTKALHLSILIMFIAQFIIRITAYQVITYQQLTITRTTRQLIIHLVRSNIVVSIILTPMPSTTHLHVRSNIFTEGLMVTSI